MPSRNPLRCGGTDLPIPLLLIAKLLVACVLALSVWRGLPDPFLPFVAALDYFRGTPFFRWTLKAVVLAGSVAVLLNYRVRTACLLIGSAFLLGILASRIYFQNNRTFLACVFILLGLYERRTGPWLLRAQVCLVFFSAALNKLLDYSWCSGRFFDYWSATFINNSLYSQLDSWLPAMLLPRIMSWATIGIEFTIALGLLCCRTRPLAIWLGLLLAIGMNALTGRTFGVFFYAMPICYLAFVNWPRSRIQVLYDGDCGFCNRTRRLMERFDLEKLFVWTSFQKATALHGISEEDLQKRSYVVTQDKQYSGFRAFRIMALFNPLTYFLILAALLLPEAACPDHRPAAAILLAFLFSPLFVPVGETVYMWIARNRHRAPGGGSCVVG